MKKSDWVTSIIVLLLIVIGLITLYSIEGTQTNSFFNRQIIFVAIGLFFYILSSIFDYRIFKNHTYILIIAYVLAIVLLVVVLLMGSVTRGVLGWITIGPLNFQPVELAKLVIILILAKYFSSRHVEMYRIRHIIVSGIYVFIPFLLVNMQPDLGSAILFIFIWLGVMLVAGIKIKHLAILALMAILVFSVSWYWLLKDYQKNRIISFLDPQIDIQGYGYNVFQSLIAIGSGGFYGMGFEQATQSKLNFLPEQQTDFIFATFAEQWGLVGVIILLILYALLFYRMLHIALNASNNFARLYIVGLFILIFAQIMINIGMNMSLLPVIGISLPFISYGGSNLIILLISLGLVQNMKIRS